MKNLYIVCFLVLTICFTQTSQAQFLDNLKKKTEEKIKKEGEKRVEDKVNKGVEKTYDAAEKQLKGNNDTKKEGEKKVDDKTNKTVTKNEPQNDQQFAVNSKYDFFPGEKVIFYDDFTAENIGDFPVQWNTTGSGEVVTASGVDGRWFKITNGRGIYTLMEPLKLPENYTIEFDLVPQKDPKNNSNVSFNFYLLSTTKPKDLMFGIARPGGTGMKYTFGYTNYYSAYYSDGTPNQSGIEQEPKFKADKKYRISIWVQKERIRLYVDQTKLFDNPKVISKNVKYNMIRFDGGTPMIGNFRIATGLPDMRSKLLTEGKLISYGIYFDVNKDAVKAESYPSIKEIAAILKDNPNIKIKIVGHTDSDGDDNSNLDLSKRRSLSVKTALVTNFNIEASRIETDGKGEIEPLAPNDNVTNKALNRRVEFIKL
jgi:outer membrane protein OmpA-like peptidoglycan-associated protein